MSNKKIEKTIAKAIKIVNKEIYNDRHFLGRYVIRDCFHQIEQTKEKGLLLACCFEYIDKANNFKKFYGFSSAVFENEISVEKFIKQLKLILDEFITTTVPERFVINTQIKDFRYVKID